VRTVQLALFELATRSAVPSRSLERVMYRIIVTPPEEEAREAAAADELRSLGVRASMIDLALGKAATGPTIPPSARPPTATAAATIEGFERMRIDSGAADVSSPSADSAAVDPPAMVRPTRSASGDELMMESLAVVVEDAPMDPSCSPPPAPSSELSAQRISSDPSELSTQQRIPSALFKHTFVSPDGFLLPPISNPDLGPSLTRADSFWVGDEAARIDAGERNLEEHWEKRQNEEAKESGPSSTALTIGASKTKSIYASALQPRRQAGREQDHLIDEDDWSSVLDATVLVAHHELTRPMNDSPDTPSTGHSPHIATRSVRNGASSLAADELQSLKRKHHPHHHHAKNKHIRVVAAPVSEGSSGSSAYSSSSSPTANRSPALARAPSSLAYTHTMVGPSAALPDSDSASASESEEDEDATERHVPTVKAIADVSIAASHAVSNQDTPMDEANCTSKCMQLD
jgi:hypothetical protein